MDGGKCRGMARGRSRLETLPGKLTKEEVNEWTTKLENGKTAGADEQVNGYPKHGVEGLVVLLRN